MTDESVVHAIESQKRSDEEEVDVHDLVDQDEDQND